MLNSDLMNRIACLKKVVDAMFQDDAPEVGQALNFCINLIFYKEEMNFSRSKTIKDLGFKLGDFAFQLNISPQYLSDVLHGRKTPSYKLSLKMQDLTGISFLYFLLDPMKARFFKMDKFDEIKDIKDIKNIYSSLKDKKNAQ